ncbi:MAG TPA: hypothetical protein VLI90_12665, partial [Tepidisphaeraceae bacterium]|nr:hypothetical protein [Tepidisphaeraceae bacterium]
MSNRTPAAALAVAAAVGLLGLFPRPACAIIVEQIEAYSDAVAPYSHYTPIDFAGQSTVTVNDGGMFNGIAFHALRATTNTFSNHANLVGSLVYGSSSVANPYVTDVYVGESTSFIWYTAGASNVQSTSGSLPNHFVSGAQVINNSYIASLSNTLDCQRRIDFMINRDDVTFLAGAANPPPSVSTFVTWSSYNALAVRGLQSTFDPTNSPGKTHADLCLDGRASFTAAIVSGYAAGLYGQAQSAGQTDAAHGVVMRSLLMAGADKTLYARQTANNLDVENGAGQPNYYTSLSMLQNGETPFDNVAADGTISGGFDPSLRGWSYGTIPGGSANQSAVLIHVPAGGARGVTASLNWNVTQNQPTAGTIDTTDAGVVFPKLSLELRPVNTISKNGVSSLALGPSLNDPTLSSAAANDNVQYLYSTNTLPAGDYAFVITGDASAARSAAVGFSYSVLAPVRSQWSAVAGGSWSSASNWSGGVPTYGADRATFSSASGFTGTIAVTLDGNRSIGQLTFGDAHGFSIGSGAGGGTLTIDDTGDAPGVTPLITVAAGNQRIGAPLALAIGATANIAVGASLNLAGPVIGSGNLTKTGGGSLTLSGAGSSFGDTLVTAGSFTLSSGASIARGNLSVSPGATVAINGSLPASATVTAGGATVFAGNNAQQPRIVTLASLQIGSNTIVTVAPSASAMSPTVLAPAVVGFTDAGSILNLSNNELITTEPFATARQWIISGQIIGTSTSTERLGSMDLDNGQSEIRCTLFGDANLDGQVGVQDLGAFSTNYGRTSGARWQDGDFSYDGAVNVSDLGYIATFFGSTLSSMGVSSPAGPTAIAATVPEPVCVIPLVLLMTTLRRSRGALAREPSRVR